MIAIGADHGGFKMKGEIEKYLDENDIKYKDFGCFNEDRTDYPIYAEKVAKSIQSNECDLGILICKSGAGMTVTANKFKGIRCACPYNEEMARLAKADDNVNVLAISAQYLTISEVVAMIRLWIGTEFKGGRYQDRLDMISNIESNEMK